MNDYPQVVDKYATLNAQPSGGRVCKACYRKPAASGSTMCRKCTEIYLQRCPCGKLTANDGGKCRWCVT